MAKKISQLDEADWQLFLDWAAEEGWTVPFQERRLFQGPWRPSFFALRNKLETVGFVSAVAYKESGWIGNLLVGPQQRGRGYGSALFDYALNFLRRSQVKKVWLTASPQGRPIYQRRGFGVVDQVVRWQARGLGGREMERSGSILQLLERDKACWKESRSPLLNVLLDDGEICQTGESILLLQPGVTNWQIGPWLSPKRCPRENRLLLTEALEKTPTGRPLLVDLLNSAELDLLLRTAGFNRIASNELMCLSDEPVRLEGVVALASLGSIG